MSLFRSSVRPPSPISDETIERYLAVIRADLRPDPLFRRRLRGHVMNRYVAAREGLSGDGHRPVKDMGRLGRAVLYASFALALSVTGAMAASQQAIPGDAFYPLKLQIESLRVRIVPDHMLDDLAAHSLAERIAELDRLADAGEWAAVDAHVAAVEVAYRSVLALSPTSAATAENLELADEMMERLPAPAQASLERALGRGVGPTRAGAGGDEHVIAPPTPSTGSDRGSPPPDHEHRIAPPTPPAKPDDAGDAGGGPPAEPADPSATPRPQPHVTRPPAPTKPPRPSPAPTPSDHAGPEAGDSG